ncbi:hypothetical protein [Skermania piniformis]|uniref:Uncharacterized protein n=1 Tax=Skermania pinensis TaxID=39122 RepID=A0ABX8SB08_9ACTN|nr:hypothetical protein [Skermania piniformis]QXQ14179.1 hypothetical protein KV203_01665 [Skermania piniformis]
MPALSSLAGRSVASATPSPEAVHAGLRSTIRGIPVDQAAVAEWERRRVPVAAARLARDFGGVLGGELDSLLTHRALPVADLPGGRAALARARAAIGVDRMRELLAPEIVASENVTRAAVASSSGSWAIAEAVIDSARGTAAGFADWFDRARIADARDIWTDACPDHYVIVTGADGRQEVIETTGGAVLPSRFFCDYTDLARVPIPGDPAYPVTIAATAALATGELIGGVRHQFRDLPGGGFGARLRVAFPIAVPELNIVEHSWHLATEFGNWITAYLDG